MGGLVLEDIGAEEDNLDRRGAGDAAPRSASTTTVEALVVVAMGLDVPLEDWRGVAPAGSVLEVRVELHAA